MRDKLDRLEKADIQVLAIDPHDSWSTKFLLKDAGFENSDLSFPLLLDPAQIVSATYGVAFQMRIHTELSNRPATFLIDKQGIVRYARRATSFSDRPTPDEIVAQLDD